MLKIYTFHVIRFPQILLTQWLTFERNSVQKTGSIWGMEMEKTLGILCIRQVTSHTLTHIWLSAATTLKNCTVSFLNLSLNNHQSPCPLVVNGCNVAHFWFLVIGYSRYIPLKERGLKLSQPDTSEPGTSPDGVTKRFLPWKGSLIAFDITHPNEKDLIAVGLTDQELVVKCN